MPTPKKASKRPAPTRPLSCHKCGSATLTIDRDTDYAKVNGERRVVASASCSACGHWWMSRHPEAVKRAREARVA